MKQQRRKQRRKAGTWWIAGISFPLGNGKVGILPPVLGLAHDDQDRAIVRAMLAAVPWSRALGGDYEKALPELRIQALAVAARDVPRVQQELETQRDSHPDGHAREAALITLGQSPEAEAVPIPQYLRDMKSPRHAGCKHARPVELEIPRTRIKPR